MFYVDIYSCRAHWGNLIEEICDSFETEAQAKDYAKVIEKYNPNYRIEICAEQERKDIELC